MKGSRCRRDFATQLTSVLHAAEWLVGGKGRFKGQYVIMDKSMQRDLIIFLGFVHTLKIKYEAFLMQKKPESIPPYLIAHFKEYQKLRR